MYSEKGAKLKFRKDFLNKPEDVKTIKINYSFLKTEDDMALSAKFVEIAKKEGAEKLEQAFIERMKVEIRRAMKNAEENNEFEAMAVIGQVQEKYGTPVKSGSVDTEKTDEVKLTKDNKVNPKVWDAILAKAGKVGLVVASTGTKATLRIKSAETKAFKKACEAVPGIAIG